MMSLLQISQLKARKSKLAIQKHLWMWKKQNKKTHLNFAEPNMQILNHVCEKCLDNKCSWNVLKVSWTLCEVSLWTGKKRKNAAMHNYPSWSKACNHWIRMVHCTHLSEHFASIEDYFVSLPEAILLFWNLALAWKNWKEKITCLNFKCKKFVRLLYFIDIGKCTLLTEVNVSYLLGWCTLCKWGNVSYSLR